MTAARFQLAMDCGCDVAAMQDHSTLSARYMVWDSLETQSVLTLAKMYDYKWSRPDVLCVPKRRPGAAKVAACTQVSS
jgi:hypothetical protein